jgi:uncharacterized membrane-anchored protein YitT (DUF2179 family)
MAESGKGGGRDGRLRGVFEYALIIVGAGLQALAFDTLMLPNQVVAGGVTGIAVIADLTLRVPFGTALVVINLPLLWLQWRYLGGPRQVLRSVVGVVSLALFTDLLAPWLPVLTHDRLLIVAYGGVLGGLGLAMVFHGRGTTGGTDILGRLCYRRFGWSFGRTMLAVNGLVYGLAAALYGPEPAMLALLLSYVMSHTLDAALHGLSSSRAVWIVSENPNDVRDAVTRDLGRGLTLIPAEGGHSGRQKTMFYVVVPRADIQRLKRRVAERDPTAFVTVLTPRESMGGFHLAPPQ